eukprot:1161467-Pelagomonas_calceolata.AAC.1
MGCTLIGTISLNSCVKALSKGRYGSSLIGTDASRNKVVTGWCKDKNKIPDTQFGFYPGRNTLQPIFILRHLQHAAQ